MPPDPGPGTMAGMPNWCSNELRVSGPTADVETFLSDAASPLSFNTLLPRPSFGNLDREAWFQWSVMSWGTKWDIDPNQTEVELSDAGAAVFTFMTAWSPPVEFVAHASTRYPTLEFLLSYAEGGADFAGQQGFRAGEMVRSAAGSWQDVAEPATSEDDEEYRDLSGPLYDVCSALAEDRMIEMVHGVDQILDAELTRDELETVLAVLPRLYSYKLSHKVVTQPQFRRSDVSDLVVLALASMTGGACVDAIVHCGDPYAAPAARLLRLLAPAVGIGSASMLGTPPVQQATQVTEKVQRYLDAAFDAGMLDEYVNACETLLGNWQTDADDLLEAAWRLTER